MRQMFKLYSDTNETVLIKSKDKLIPQEAHFRNNCHQNAVDTENKIEY